VSHLLSFLVVKAIGEIDIMVQQGGLGGGRRDDGHLEGGVLVQNRMRYESGEATHRLVVQKEHLHLGSCLRLHGVSGRHHLGDVAGDGLGDVHGWVAWLGMEGAVVGK